jgi:hypothetical protein
VPVALCQDNEAAGHNSTATVSDDEADGHNSTATISDTVPAYRFMAWLDGEPDLLAMEDQFSFVEMSKMWLTTKTTIYHSNLVKVTPQSTSNLPPCLATSGHLSDVQDTAPEYIHH